MCEGFEPSLELEPVEAVGGLVTDETAQGPTCSSEDVNGLVPGAAYLMISEYAGQVEKFKAQHEAQISQLQAKQDPWAPVLDLDYEVSFSVKAGASFEFVKGELEVTGTEKWGGSFGQLTNKPMQNQGWGVEIFGTPLPWLDVTLSFDPSSWHLELDFYLGTMLNQDEDEDEDEDDGGDGDGDGDDAGDEDEGDDEEDDPSQGMIGTDGVDESGKPNMAKILAKNGPMVELAMDLVVKLAVASSKPKVKVKSAVTAALSDWIRNDVSRMARKMAKHSFRFLLAEVGQTVQSMLKHFTPEYTHWYTATLTLDKQSDGDTLPKLGLVLKSQREMEFEILGQSFLQYSGAQYDLAPLVNSAYNFKMSKVSQRALLNRQHANQDERSAHCIECSRQVENFLKIDAANVEARIKQYKKHEKCDGGGNWEALEIHRCNNLKTDIIKLERAKPGRMLELSIENPNCPGRCPSQSCAYQNVCGMTLLSVTCQKR